MPALMLGFTVGALTNLATGGSATVPVLVGLGVTVLAAIVLSVLQERAAETRALTAARVERDRLIAPPFMPLIDPATASLPALVSASASVGPYQNVGTRIVDELVSWCVDDRSVALAVLDGAGGVGKSRVIVELALRCPEGWIVGRVLGWDLEALHNSVVAAAQPAVVVIDDADLVPCLPLLERVLDGPRTAQTTVRYLLVARDASALTTWLSVRLPGRGLGDRLHRIPNTPHSWGIGDPGGRDVFRGDRARWYCRALDAYRETQELDPLLLSQAAFTRVGQAGEPMVVVQVRAALAALDGDPEAPFRLAVTETEDLARSLMERERERWRRSALDSSRGLPERRGPEAYDLVVPLLMVVHRGEHAAARTQSLQALCAMRRFAGLSNNDLGNVVDWFEGLYPDYSTGGQTSARFLSAAVIAGSIDNLLGPDLDCTKLARIVAADNAAAGLLLQAGSVFEPVLRFLAELAGTEALPVATIARAAVLSGDLTFTTQQLVADLVSGTLLDPSTAEELVPLVELPGRLVLRAAVLGAAVAWWRTSNASPGGDKYRDLLSRWGASLQRSGLPGADTVLDEAYRLWAAAPRSEARNRGLAYVTAHRILAEPVRQDTDAVTDQCDRALRLVCRQPGEIMRGLEVAILVRLAGNLRYGCRWRRAQRTAARAIDVARELVVVDKQWCGWLSSALRTQTNIELDLLRPELASQLLEEAQEVLDDGSNLDAVQTATERCQLAETQARLYKLQGNFIAAERTFGTAVEFASMPELARHHEIEAYRLDLRHLRASVIADPSRRVTSLSGIVDVFRARSGSRPNEYARAKLTSTLKDLGAAQRLCGDLPAALAALEESVAVAGELVADDLGYRSELINSYVMLAELTIVTDANADTGSRRVAEMLSDALQLGRALTVDEPDYVREFVDVLDWMASVERSGSWPGGPPDLDAEAVAWIRYAAATGTGDDGYANLVSDRSTSHVRRHVRDGGGTGAALSAQQAAVDRLGVMYPAVRAALADQTHLADV